MNPPPFPAPPAADAGPDAVRELQEVRDGWPALEALLSGFLAQAR